MDQSSGRFPPSLSGFSLLWALSLASSLFEQFEGGERVRSREKRAERQAGEPHTEGRQNTSSRALGSHAEGSQIEMREKSARSRRRFAVAAWLLIFVGALFLLAPDITDFVYRSNAANQLDTVWEAAAFANEGNAASDGAGDAAPSEQANAEDSAIQLAQAGASALPWLKDYNERVRSGAGPAVNDPFAFSSADGGFAETGLSSGPV